MAIVESVIISDTQLGQASRKIRERHTDHLGNEYFKTVVVDVDITQIELNALLASHGQALDRALADQEIQQAIAVYENGGDPLHFEESPNNWQRITPDYQTWEELAQAVLLNFLSRSEKLDLAYIYTTITRISSQTKSTLLDVNVPTVSDINADIQDAYNIRVALDAYVPYF